MQKRLNNINALLEDITMYAKTSSQDQNQIHRDGNFEQNRIKGPTGMISAYEVTLAWGAKGPTSALLSDSMYLNCWEGPKALFVFMFVI